MIEVRLPFVIALSAHTRSFYPLGDRPQLGPVIPLAPGACVWLFILLIPVTILLVLP